MKIVLLDAATLGEDIDLSVFSSLGEVTVYPATAPHEVKERLAGADVAVVNKIKMNAETLGDDPSVRLICVTATGYDNIDLDFCRTHGIAATNVVGYSTDSVAQITVAMALSLLSHLPAHAATVRSGAYTAGGVANCLQPTYHELAGKTWGIVGFGNIGRRVAAVANAFGCRVIAFKRTPAEGVACVDLDTLCRESDIISVHLPLSAGTRGIIGEYELSLMKKDAILINVARGAVVDEAALARAVAEDRLGGIGVDVYSVEPMPLDHPFYALRERENVLLTPHMAWGAVEARERCLAEVAENIHVFLAGLRRNRLD